MNDHVADAPADNWVDRFMPRGFRPYARLMRLDRSIGWWLLLLPCWWALTLAQISAGGGMPNLRYALLFLLGAIIMRGAGCTLNDIADKDFDAQVARTRSRPIPSGQLSVRAAVVFLILQCILGLAILLQFNWTTVAIGAASLAIIAIYPFMKRFTYWPQIFLGLAFNWGALVGWSAIHEGIALPSVILYLGGIAWTLAYDTIYAHQDKEDDLLIGVKSTALKFGASSPYWIGGFFILALLLFEASIWLAQARLLAHMGVAAAALHAAWQIWRLDINDPLNCLRLFRSNREFGLLLLLGPLLDTLTR